jgi:hypothetical protein
MNKSIFTAVLLLAWVDVGSSLYAQQFAAPLWETLKPILKIDWQLGPDYPMGIQDSAVGVINRKLVSAGGFTRHPLNILEQHPDAFGSEPSGFTKLTFALKLDSEPAEWHRIPDLPSPARQGAAVAVVDNALYVMGGINYSEPLTYRQTYRLREENGQWIWDELKSCELPWPVYGAAGSTAVIGKRIFILGAADYFQRSGAATADFHSAEGRDGSPAGRALLVLDTSDVQAGWKRLADCPGLPKFDSAVAAVGGKIYQLGGIFSRLHNNETGFHNAVDSWMYDPTTDGWSRLQDMPDGANRRALPYADRYILLIAGYTYGTTWHTDGTQTNAGNGDAPVKQERPGPGEFQKTVLVYDTLTGTLGTADSLIEQTSYPSSDIVGDTIYCLGGEGGPRLIHPATLQIGRIAGPVQ